MSPLCKFILLPLLLAPSVSLAQTPVDGSNLHIRTQSNNAAFVMPTTSITRLSTEGGTRGHFWAGAGIGLLSGALIGGLIGSTTQFCIDECSPDDRATGVGIILGAPAGFLLGGIIGSLIRTDRPIRVAPRLGALGFTVGVGF